MDALGKKVFAAAVLSLAFPLSCSTLALEYFAYGANCDVATLSRRLRATGLEEGRRFAVLEDYSVRFSVVGVPGIEPSFASITPSNGESTPGVLYTLTGAHFNTLCVTEGVPLVYTVREVNCCIGRTEVVAAKTLMAVPQRCFPLGLQVRPSQRYLNLILNGLKESDTPRAYIAAIRKAWT